MDANLSSLPSAAGPAGSSRPEPAPPPGRVALRLPPAVVILLAVATMWFFLAAWVGFDRGGDDAESLGVASVFALGFGVLFVTAAALTRGRSATSSDLARLRDVLASGFETATGRTPGDATLVQILVMPFLLAVLMTVLALIWRLSH